LKLTGVAARSPEFTVKTIAITVTTGSLEVRSDGMLTPTFAWEL